MNSFSDLEPKLATGAIDHADAVRVASCLDLVSVGALGEMARKKLHGDRVTYGRVLELGLDALPANRGEAREVRLVGTPGSTDDAIARVRAAANLAAGAAFTGFSVADLVALVGGDHMALADFARDLKAAGLEAVAAVPLDRLDDPAEVVRAILHGGLAAWRATIDQATYADRLALIERARDVQRETSAFKAFAPLPRIDARDTPSTGYDDVRTIALARIVCHNIPLIQVDWPLYGPKLAQVAITYGADDIDGIAAVDTPNLGPRRSPREDIERQIIAASAMPSERTGRYEIVL